MLSLVLLLATADAPKADDQKVIVDCVVAVVNKSIVLHSEVESLLDQMMAADPLPPGVDPEKGRAARRNEILDTLIAERLLEEEVRKLRIDVTDAEVDRVVQGTMKEHNLDLEKLKVALQRQGLTLDEYREGLKKQLTKMKIVQLKVKNRVNVDDSEVKAAYNQRKLLDERDFKVKARHILFLVPPGQPDADAKQRANAALQRLKSGADFSALAKEMSEDPGSKNQGGSLGEFGRGEMVPEFEKVAFTTEPGKVAGPVRTQFGWHLILVEERVPVKARPEEEAIGRIRDLLFQQRVEAEFNAYLEELKRASHIEKRSTCQRA
jgi:peptidyl-prolyl cis-trans isomerase SurA